jgi:hypothetical protein
MKMTLEFGLAGPWEGWIIEAGTDVERFDELRSTVLDRDNLVRQSPNTTLANEPGIRPSLEQKSVFIIFPTRALMHMPQASSTHARSRMRERQRVHKVPTLTANNLFALRPSPRHIVPPYQPEPF